MKLIRALAAFWVLLVALAFGAFICTINTDPVVIRLPPDMELRLPLAIALICAFLYGATTVILYFFWDLTKKSLELRRLNKQLRQWRDLGPATSTSQHEPKPFVGG